MEPQDGNFRFFLLKTNVPPIQIPYHYNIKETTHARWEQLMMTTFFNCVTYVGQ